MTSTWTDEPETEDYPDSEGDYDAEADYDAEDYRSDAARRARARRLAMARRRMLDARARRPVTTVARPATPPQTAAAIRNLDLDTKVEQDSVRRALEATNRRATRATYATLASVGIDQAFDSFSEDLGDHDVVRAGLRFAPLLLLTPHRRRRGLEGVVMDPRFIGGATILGLVAASQLRNRGLGASGAEIQIDDSDITQASGQLMAVATTRAGKDVTDDIVWASKDPDKLDVQSNGRYSAKSAGTARVTATVEGRTVGVFIEVTQSATQTPTQLQGTPPPGGPGTGQAQGSGQAQGGGQAQGSGSGPNKP
jgi:hypothetical protein